jgi:hypothetical protein
MVQQIRRGPESGRAGITPALGELILTTGEHKLYMGDGVQAGGFLVGPFTGIGQLGDVDLASVAPTGNESILRYNGTNWGVTTHDLNSLINVSGLDAVVDGQTFVYNGGTNRWTTGDGLSLSINSPESGHKLTYNSGEDVWENQYGPSIYANDALMSLHTGHYTRTITCGTGIVNTNGQILWEYLRNFRLIIASGLDGVATDTIPYFAIDSNGTTVKGQFPGKTALKVLGISGGSAIGDMASAAFRVNARYQGSLFAPIMHSGQRTSIPSPNAGIAVYQTGGFFGHYYNDGDNWRHLGHQDTSTALSSSFGTVSWNGASGSVATLAMTGGAYTLNNIDNSSEGHRYTLIATLGSDPASLAFDSSFLWPGGSAPAINLNATDVMEFVRGTGDTYYGTFSQSFL